MMSFPFGLSKLDIGKMYIAKANQRVNRTARVCFFLKIEKLLNYVLSINFFWRPMWSDDTPPFYAWFIKRDAGGNRTHHIHMVEAHYHL